MSGNDPLLQATELKKYFDQNQGLFDRLRGQSSEPIQAVDGVSIQLAENEVQGVIGESGCGKSTLLKTLLGLTGQTDGEILFQGRPLSEFDSQDWKEFRRNVQVVFQNPFDSLDPKLTVEETLRIPLNVHGIENQDERLHDVLEQVQLRPVDRYIQRYPDSLSGGEMQRVSIARALVLEPKVLLADEPVSMLDVSTQTQVLTLLANLVDDLDLSMMYISHDLSTVGYLCDTINVMYLGRIIETGPTEDVLDNPYHPYTEALINAVPIPDPSYDRTRTGLDGSIPDPTGIGEGCRFRDRCPERMDVCDRTPKFIQVDDDHGTACHLHYDHEEHLSGENTGDGPRGREINPADSSDGTILGAIRSVNKKIGIASDAVRTKPDGTGADQ